MDSTSKWCRKRKDIIYIIDYSEVFDLVKKYLIEDGYTPEELDDEDIDNYIYDYIDELKEHFYDEALEAFKECCDYESDPLGYYGFSISDFI